MKAVKVKYLSYISRSRKLITDKQKQNELICWSKPLGSTIDIKMPIKKRRAI